MSGSRPEAQGWRLQVTLDRAIFERLEEALGEHADAVVAETVEATYPLQEAPADLLRATLFGTASAADDPRPDQLRTLFRAAGVAPDGTAVEPLDPADWETRSLASFPPVSVGRLTIVGAHQVPPFWRFVLRVDAGPAFGSGRHESTQAACSPSTGWRVGSGCAVRWTSARAPASSRWQRRGSGQRGCSPSIATLWRSPGHGRPCGGTGSLTGLQSAE